MRWTAVLVAIWTMGATAWGTETPLPLLNGSFEDGFAHWKRDEATTMTTLITEGVKFGKQAIRIDDRSKKHGSSLLSDLVPLPPGRMLVLRGKNRNVESRGAGIWVRFYDKNKKWLGPRRGSKFYGMAYLMSDRWQSFSNTIYPAEGAAYVALWVHSYNGSTVVVEVDDLELLSSDVAVADRPWPGQYKIRPDEKKRLTAADVVGPDGIVYPDWSRAGVQGGIPDVPEVVRASKFGAKPDDDLDDAEAIERACAAVGDKGGGAVVLDAGTYHLDRSVTIYDSGVVIRGAGRDKTHVVYRYELPKSGIGFMMLADGDKIGRATVIDLRARPKGLKGMRIVARQGDKEYLFLKAGQSIFTDRLFSHRRTASRLFGQFKEGEIELEGHAFYKDGSELTTRVRGVLDASHDGHRQVTSHEGAFAFQGRTYAGSRRYLTRDGKRGDFELALDSTKGIGVGAKIWVRAPSTKRWNELVRNACPHGNFRIMEVQVEGVTSDTITINQPLRLDFPVIDKSEVRPLGPIEYCGIEDLSITHTNNLWVVSVFFRNTWNSWMRRVDVTMCGRKAFQTSMAKWCEVRDCVVDSSYWNGGAAAYMGWENAWDCLMDGVTGYKMRHAPVFQWGTSGCVIRNCNFHHADGQWHAGWTNENLIENCSIRSRKGYGSYGYGMWASPPEDTGHGPNGPRNVVYNCRVDSEKDGVVLGGMNENWIFVYNRFETKSGAGFRCKTASFDHILKDNVFVVHDKDEAMVRIGTPDCVGIDLIGNRLYGGNGKLVEGPAKPEEMKDNKVGPLEDAPAPDAMPEPPVPSIFLWQRENVRR